MSRPKITPPSEREAAVRALAPRLGRADAIRLQHACSFPDVTVHAILKQPADRPEKWLALARAALPPAETASPPAGD